MDANKVVVNLHSSLAELESDWLFLQKNGLCTFFQTYEWCKAWHETAGEARRAEPAVICGRDPEGNLLFILPFAIERHLGSQVLYWYSAAEITYGMGVFDRRFLNESPLAIEQLWPDILSALGGIDAVRLDNQPQAWEGVDNPLRFLFTTRGANQSYRMSLLDDYQTLYEQKRSASSRRGARKRDKKLFAAGDVKFGLPETGHAIYDLINTMINQQQDRLGQKGIRSVYDETRRAFLHQLANATKQDGTPVLLPYYLSVDEEICAVMLGGSFQSTYWALISSLTPDSRLYNLSPGDHALRATIEAVCNRQYRVFDFAAGDTDYKIHWSDEIVPLFETIEAVTTRGTVLSAVTAIKTTAKRVVKQTPWLFSLAQSIRTSLLRKKT